MAARTARRDAVKTALKHAVQAVILAGPPPSRCGGNDRYPDTAASRSCPLPLVHVRGVRVRSGERRRCVITRN